MGFVKGQAKIGGRVSGVPNKISASFKQAVAMAFEEIGGAEAFSEWAGENRGEFYRIVARLVPPESKTPEAEEIICVVNR